MKFFIPELEGDPACAEEVLIAIAKFVGAPLPEPDKRIRRIAYRHNGKNYTAEVGKPVARYYEEKEDTVLAIIGANPVCICLPFRGVLRGIPILVGSNAVDEIVFFDP